MGGGAIQLTLTNGVPQTYVSTFDSGWYMQDDWRVRPNLTLSGGLRLEQQTGIADHLDWEPRVALAWGIGRAKSVPKTVLRIGTGLFYDRFTENLILQANRLNGINQEKFVVTSPCFFNSNSVPSINTIKAMCPASTVLPTTYSISPRLHAPGTLETAVTLEQQLGKSASISVSYLNSRGYDQLLSNNINTPLPGTFPANPVYPLGTPGNVYQFESGAVYRQNEVISQVNYRFRTRISLRGFYALNYASSNTAGPTSFPSNPFNLAQDYGRAEFDTRHRVFLGGSINLPRNIALYPFFLANSGTPYGITISRDLIGSSQFNQRPAFATAQSNPANVVNTQFGAFDTLPQAGEPLVPINSLTGPPHYSLNLRLSKTWGFGGEISRPGGGAAGGPGGGPAAEAPAAVRARGGGGGGNRGGAGGGGFGGPGGGGGGTNRRYNLTFAINARNIFNYENLALPSGVLSPPQTPGGSASVPFFFGKSNALAGGAFSSTSASRLIYLQLGFTF